MSRAPHPEWIRPAWPAPGRVRSLITTRSGGVSAGSYASLNLGMRTGDAIGNVERNRAILRDCLPAEPTWMRQVHGTRVVVADEAEPGSEADAAVARQPGVVCAVLTADCVPVLFCDRGAEVVGIAHAGWRGLAAGVIEAAVHAMGVATPRILAYLGPGIGPDAYEVGAEVRAAFAAADPRAEEAFAVAAPGKFYADLYALARQRLARCGVTDVHGGGYCTLRDPRFFSFRREPITGRMASLIWLA